MLMLLLYTYSFRSHFSVVEMYSLHILRTSSDEWAQVGILQFLGVNVPM